MKNMKYKLTDEKREYYGKTLYRIEALKDFADVKKGNKGGWIEKEINLSQEGTCWVYGDAMVFGDALVYDNAIVYGDAMVFGDALVYDNAIVCGEARVCGYAIVRDNAKVYDNAKVRDNAIVYGYADVFGYASVCGDAVIADAKDYLVFKNNWSSGRYFTWTKSNNMWKVGCFYGKGDELIKKAYQDSELSGKCYEAIVKCVEILMELQKN